MPSGAAFAAFGPEAWIQRARCAPEQFLGEQRTTPIGNPLRQIFGAQDQHTRLFQHTIQRRTSLLETGALSGEIGVLLGLVLVRGIAQLFQPRIDISKPSFERSDDFP